MPSPCLLFCSAPRVNVVRGLGGVESEKSSGNSGREFIVSGNERRKVFHLLYITDEWEDVGSDNSSVESDCGSDASVIYEGRPSNQRKIRHDKFASQTFLPNLVFLLSCLISFRSALSDFCRFSVRHRRMRRAGEKRNPTFLPSTSELFLVKSNVFFLRAQGGRKAMAVFTER